MFPEDWTVEDLMGSHKSRPYNPLIANTFFRAGFIEAWGRGIQKIKDSCVLAGNDIPEYYVKKEDIMVLFWGLGETTPQSPQTTPQLDEIDSRIIKVIESKPFVSQRKIAALAMRRFDIVWKIWKNGKSLYGKEMDEAGNGLCCKLSVTICYGGKYVLVFGDKLHMLFS